MCKKGGVALPRYTDYDYHFGIFKLFLFQLNQPAIFSIAYIPPEYTKYSSDEAFNQIEQEYLRYQDHF